MLISVSCIVLNWLKPLTVQTIQQLQRAAELLSTPQKSSTTSETTWYCCDAKWEKKSQNKDRCFLLSNTLTGFYKLPQLQEKHLIPPFMFKHETQQKHFPTFSLTLLKGKGTAAFSDQVPSTGEAGGASHFWLVCSQWTGQTGDEAIVRVLTGRTLTWTHTQAFGQVWTVVAKSCHIKLLQLHLLD